MKILFINGSSDKNRNTASLAGELLKVLKHFKVKTG